MRDVLSSQARPRCPPTAFRAAPLVVLNNFGQEEHLKLATAMFQNMFPSINVQTVRLGNIQRVVMLNYDKETKRIQFR